MNRFKCLHLCNARPQRILQLSRIGIVLVTFLFAYLSLVHVVDCSGSDSLLTDTPPQSHEQPNLTTADRIAHDVSRSDIVILAKFIRNTSIAIPTSPEASSFFHVPVGELEVIRTLKGAELGPTVTVLLPLHIGLPKELEVRGGSKPLVLCMLRDQRGPIPMSPTPAQIARATYPQAMSRGLSTSSGLVPVQMDDSLVTYASIAVQSQTIKALARRADAIIIGNGGKRISPCRRSDGWRFCQDVVIEQVVAGQIDADTVSVASDVRGGIPTQRALLFLRSLDGRSYDLIGAKAGARSIGSDGLVMKGVTLREVITEIDQVRKGTP